MSRSADHRAHALPANDYHQLPASRRQLDFARRIAAGTGRAVPEEALADRRALSAWIERNRPVAADGFAAYPSSRQVAFAERIARLKRRQVPHECFRDRTMMSRWIDSNR